MTTTPTLVATIADGAAEVWAKGVGLYVLPAVLDAYPADLKEAIGRLPQRHEVVDGAPGARTQPVTTLLRMGNSGPPSRRIRFTSRPPAEQTWRPPWPADQGAGGRTGRA